MLMLLRLVPFVAANYNLIELGPRETGKTYSLIASTHTCQAGRCPKSSQRTMPQATDS
ncbi:MAG: BREX system Lon protease-like protein BrxL [Thermoguttaceae bacterium]